MAKGWLLSRAPAWQLLGNAVPPTTEGSGPGCPRTVLEAWHRRLQALPFASGGVLDIPSIPQPTEGWGTCTSEIPRVCSFQGGQESKSEASQV